MKTQGRRCCHALLLMLSILTLGTFTGSSQAQQKPPPEVGGPMPADALRAVGAGAIPPAATTIAHVEVGRNGQQTTVRVEGNGRLTCQTERLNNPERLVLDCWGVRLGLAQTSIPTALKPVRRVRVGQFKPDVARVVIDLEHAAPFSLKSEAKTIVVAFSGATEASSDAVAAQTGNAQAKNALRSEPTQAAQPPSSPPAAIGSSGTPRLEPLTQRKPVLGIPVTPAAQVELFENAFKYGTLTYRAQNQTLRSILQEIAQDAGVPITLTDGSGDERLSVEFRHFRLDEALRHILNGYDAFFFYGVEQESNQPASLKAVWVYPANAGRQLKPAPPDAWTASTQEFQRMLAEPDAEVRARAIDTLIRRKGGQSADAVQQALRDKDEKVRMRALSRALYSGVGIPQELLIDLVLNDESMNIRFLALQALPVDPTMRWVAERALHDSTPQISNLAQEILRELDAANVPPSPSAVNQPRPRDH